MTDRIRRAFKMPRREPDKTFVEDMKQSRREAVEQSRETIQSIQRLKKVLADLEDGSTDYNELNQVLFGRPGWPRSKETQP